MSFVDMFCIGRPNGEQKLREMLAEAEEAVGDQKPPTRNRENTGDEDDSKNDDSQVVPPMDDRTHVESDLSMSSEEG